MEKRNVVVPILIISVLIISLSLIITVQEFAKSYNEKNAVETGQVLLDVQQDNYGSLSGLSSLDNERDEDDDNDIFESLSLGSSGGGGGGGSSGSSKKSKKDDVVNETNLNDAVNGTNWSEDINETENETNFSGEGLEINFSANPDAINNEIGLDNNSSKSSNLTELDQITVSSLWDGTCKSGSIETAEGPGGYYCEFDDYEQCFDYKTKSTAIAYDCWLLPLGCGEVDRKTDFCSSDGHTLYEAWLNCGFTTLTSDAVHWQVKDCDDYDEFSIWYYDCTSTEVRRHKYKWDWGCSGSDGACKFISSGWLPYELVSKKGRSDYCTKRKEYGCSLCNRGDYDCDWNSECYGTLECMGPLGDWDYRYYDGCCKSWERWDATRRECCQCSSGVCCDGCHYYESSDNHVCSYSDSCVGDDLCTYKICDGSGYSSSACKISKGCADCGNKDCDYKNYYTLLYDNSPLTTSYCNYRDYQDCNRPCYSVACQDCSCYEKDDFIKNTAGICQYISGCSGSTPGTVRNYLSSVSCGTCQNCNGIGSCSNMPSDDSECGIVECSSYYMEGGTKNPTSTQYCYNKKDITSNRCEGLDNCKDSNTFDCVSQPNDQLKYSCGICKYISDSDCRFTNLGSCSNYVSGTSCGTNSECDGNGNCITCDSHDYFQCDENDVYWFDSCGNREEKKLPDCGTSGYTDKYCCNDDNDVCQNYIINECRVDACYSGTEVNVIDSCEYGCSYGECNPKDCKNECGPLGKKECNGSYVQTCGYYDADVCLEWGGDAYCQQGCEGGECKPEVIICSSDLQCGTDGYIGYTSCQNNDVWQNYIKYTCNYAGTVNSYCSDFTTNKLKEDCPNECTGGRCKIKVCEEICNAGRCYGPYCGWE